MQGDVLIPLARSGAAKYRGRASALPHQYAWLVLVLLGLSVVFAASMAAPPDQQPKPDAVRGERLFLENCAACHNRSRRAGPDLFFDISYFVRAGIPPQAMGMLLQKPVRMRREKSSMPYFAPEELSDADLADMAYYLASQTPVPEQPGTMGSAEHGAELYAKHCALCHGAQGEGTPNGLPVALMSHELQEGGAPPNVMLGFVNLACRSGDVPRMPTYSAEQLSDADLADLAAFVWSLPMPPMPAKPPR